MDDKKVVIKLKKQALSSEIKERRQRQKTSILVLVLCVFSLGIGILVGSLFSSGSFYDLGQDHPLINEVKYYLENYWLYSEEYDDLDVILEDKALYGMTHFEEDAYTTYQSLKEHDDFTSNINMSFVGIGVRYSTSDGINTVVEVLNDSPAERAGILAGDIIKTVDGISVDGLSSDEIRALVTGEEGTSVIIGVEREGNYLELEAIRAAVDDSIGFVIEDNIPILSIQSFGEGTYHQIKACLDEVKDYTQLIIDLRDNSGGFQTAVEQIASLFVGDDVVLLKQVYNDGSIEEAYTNGNVHYKNFEEIVVLIDEYSASAAEVLAIGLKELHPNVTLIGNTSFGKGVGQSNYVLSDGSYLKLTTYKWLSPNGKWIHEIGIEPDHKVLLDPILYESYGLMEEDDAYAYDSVSAYVRFSEMALRFLGYDVERTDGYFDASFEAALKAYQRDVKLEETAILDARTYEAIISSVIAEYSYNPLKDTQMIYAKEYLKDH